MRLHPAQRAGAWASFAVSSVAVTWAAVPTGGAAAQASPVRPATMIIPYGNGSGIDVLGRILAPAIAEKRARRGWQRLPNVGGRHQAGMTLASEVHKSRKANGGEDAQQILGKLRDVLLSLIVTGISRHPECQLRRG